MLLLEHKKIKFKCMMENDLQTLIQMQKLGLGQNQIVLKKVEIQG
jgi:hypothetical protein